jgi:septal ring factor EnvC (AmiA/AmiB activator)
MARRTMAERKRRAADRDTRRESLLVLLARLDRGPLAEQERSLLRAHVEAELSDADELRRTVAGQQTAIQRQAAQLEAAHDAIREAEQAAADATEQLHAYRTVKTPRPAPGQLIPRHTGGNAEDCVACVNTNPPYPFLCPATDTAPEPQP